MSVAASPSCHCVCSKAHPLNTLPSLYLVGEPKLVLTIFNDTHWFGVKGGVRYLGCTLCFCPNPGPILPCRVVARSAWQALLRPLAAASCSAHFVDGLWNFGGGQKRLGNQEARLLGQLSLRMWLQLGRSDEQSGVVCAAVCVPASHVLFSCFPLQRQ